MIYLYSGTPGSGKSLHMAQDIYSWCSKGLPVLCNFDINTSKIRLKKNKKLFFYYIDDFNSLSPSILKKFSYDYFKKHHFKEGIIKLFIDESQLYFNSRDWNKSNRMEWIEFFSQHRKFGFDIILVSQYDRMLDRQIRSLIEYEYVHRKVKNFGFWGKLFNLFSFGTLFCYSKIWYPLKKHLGSEFFRYNKKWDNLYDTFYDFSVSKVQ